MGFICQLELPFCETVICRIDRRSDLRTFTWIPRKERKKDGSRRDFVVASALVQGESMMENAGEKRAAFGRIVFGFVFSYHISKAWDRGRGKGS